MIPLSNIWIYGSPKSPNSITFVEHIDDILRR